VKIVGNVSSVCEEVSSISLPALYKVSFPFDLIFKKAIAVSGVYNLVDLSLIVFFIVTAVFGLNSYRRLRWLVLTWQRVVCVWPKKRSIKDWVNRFYTIRES
jgi:hypothetical protein